MQQEVLHYFRWFLGMSDTAMLLLIWMYKTDLLCAPARLALEAIEALADD